METFVATVKQLILPAITLGLFALAPIARMTRAAMLGALASEYVRTARANGLSRSPCSAPTPSATPRCPS